MMPVEKEVNSGTPNNRRRHLFTQLSLEQRTMLVVILVLAAIIGTAIYFQLHYTQQQRTYELARRGDLTAKIQASELESAVWNMEAAQIDLMLKGLAVDPDFMGARVIDPKGKIQQAQGDFITDNAVNTSAPIVHDNQPLGKLELNLSTTGLRADLGKLTMIYVGFGLLLIILTDFALYGSLRMIIRPMAKLSRPLRI